jgi:hypothetical protein
MFKIAAIIGGVLLMAGVALAGTLTSVDSTNSPTIGTTTLPAVSTERQDRTQENELEQRGRANEPGEDVRGPCDEPEHANDSRCTGAPVQGDDDNGADNRGDDDSSGGSSGPGPNSGPSDSSGHDDGGDDHSGPGGGHDD